MKTVSCISSIEDLYNNQDQTTGEIFLDAVVSALKEMRVISVAKVSNAIGVDPITLSRVMKVLTGNTLSELIDYWRWHKVLDLLTQTDIPIKDVAYQCGIANVTGLNRISGEKFGMTPVEIRQRKKRRHWKWNM